MFESSQIKAIAIFAAGFLALSGSFAVGYKLAANRYKVKISNLNAAASQRDAELNKQIADNANKVLELERQLAAKSGENEAAYNKGLDDGKKEADKIIADFESGANRLRPALSKPCPKLPATPSNPTKPDEGSTAGLQAEDVKFLVRESERADKVVEQLRFCQATLSGWRAIVNGEGK